MVRATAMAAIGLVLGSHRGAWRVHHQPRRARYKVTIIEGEAKTDHVLKPSQTLSDVCLKGCTIRVNGNEDDEYRLTGGDVVSIEDGTVYYDAPETPEDPASPATKGKARGRTKG